MRVTRSHRHWFQLVILVNLLIYQLAVISANDQTLSATGTDADVEQHMYILMDEILKDLTDKYDTIKTDEFWHPYDFGTGNDNREVINVVGILEHHIPGNFIQWKKAQLGLKQQLVGLTPNSIEIYDSKLQRTFIKDDMPATLKTMEVFTNWNTATLTPFTVIAVATTTPRILLFTVSSDEALKEIGSFPLHSSVQSISMCSVQGSKKIMAVPDDTSEPITIYNVEISQDEAQFWFFQRLSETDFDSAIVHQPDTVSSMLVISKNNKLAIYHFDSSLKQFSVQQKLQLQQSCNSMLPFAMMYQHYVACMTAGTSKEVQFISYNFNMNEYEESVLNKVEASQMFPVAIGGSRGDTIFVTRKTSNTPIDTLIYNGQNEFSPGSISCHSDACAKLSTLSNGVSFDMEDSNALVLPTSPEEDKATVLTFMTEVTPTASPVFQQSKGLFVEFKDLSNKLNGWRTAVTHANDILGKKLDTEGDNVITGSWTVKTLIAEEVDVEEGRMGRASSDNVFNSLKFGSVEWTEEDFESATVTITEGMDTMKSNLLFVDTELKDALRKDSSQVQFVKSTVTMLGQISAENLQARTLNVKSMFSNEPGEFFQSLASKKSNILNVEGGITFSELLTTRNVETSSLNGVLVDNLAVLSGDNVFKCQSSFESLHTSKDILVELVNGQRFVDSVVMANNINGFNFVNGIVAYEGVELNEHTPFEDLLLSSQVQNVEAPMLFESMEMLNPVSVQNVNGKNFQSFAEKVVSNSHQGKITGTKTFTESVNTQKLFITKEWNQLAFPGDFVSTSQSNVVFNGEKSFENLVANQVFANAAINDIVTQDLVSLTERQILENAKWIFTGTSSIFDNIAVENTVDGILMESLLHQGLLDSSSSMFTPNADIILKNPVHIEDLVVSSTINDQVFDDLFGALILFEGELCHIPGNTVIEQMASFENLEILDNKINDFSVENFLTRDTPQTISNPVVMTDNVFFDKLHALGTFDTILVEELLARATRVSATTKAIGTMIPWDIHFESIQCQSSLNVDGPINNLAAFANSVAVTKGRTSQIINGPVQSLRPTFFSNLAVKSLELDVGRTLQTLDINAWNESRARLSEPAIFTHPVSVSRITVKKNLETPIINGISVEELKTNVFRSNGKSQQFSGPVVLKQGLSVHNGDVRFHKSVDGFILDDYINHGFPLKAKNNKPIVINSNNWQFKSMSVANGVQTNINNVCGVDLDALQQDSVKRDENNVNVFGQKSFSRALTITNSLRAPQLNGKQMGKVFLLQGSQEIEEQASFASDVFKDVLSVDSINNIEMAWLAEKFSFENGEHVINHDVLIKNLKMNSLEVQQQTQDKNLNEFMANTVQVNDKNVKFENDVEFIQPVSVLHSINTGLYNGINVDRLSERVVMLDKDTTLTQPVTFTNSIGAEKVIVNGDVTAASLSNGVNWNDLQTKSIKLNSAGKKISVKSMRFANLVAGQPIETSEFNGRPVDDLVTLNTPQDLGSLRFAKVSLESSTVDLKGTFGSHDISDEFQDTLMNNKQEPQKLAGTTIINGLVHIRNDLTCFGSELKEDAVTTSDTLDLGPVEFESPIVVESDMTITEPINGHSVMSLFSGAFFTEGGTEDQVISDQWEFLGPVTFLNEVTGKAVGDSVNIEALVEKKNEELRRAQQQVEGERENFIRTCNSLLKMRNQIAKNPVKLDSFDTHQVIALKNEGTNVLPVEHNDGVMLLLQTANCKLDRYEWHPSTELFHKVVDDTSDNIGVVDAWQSAPLKEGGSVVVFSKSVSKCSQEAGLFTVTISSDGELSPVVAIRSNHPVKSFKLLTKPDTGETRLFNLMDKMEPGVEVFSWADGQFSFENFINLESPMDRVDVTSSSRGFGLMCHNANSVMMYDISKDHTEDTLASGSMLTSSTGTMAVFENFDTLFALLAESGSQTPSFNQPTCNFQVLRLSGNVVESVQKLQVPKVVSTAIWSFENKNFVSFLSESFGLGVYKFKGLSGFKPVGETIKVFDGFMVKSFSVKSEQLDRPNPFLLVLSKNSLQIFRANVFGDTLHTDFHELCSNA